MNYDTISGLPTTDSFLDFVEKMWRASSPNRFGLLAMQVKNDGALNSHNKLQLHLMIKKFIRNHHELLMSACKWNNDTYTILIDTSSIIAPSSESVFVQAADSLDKMLKEYCDFLNSQFPGLSIYISAHFSPLDTQITDIADYIDHSVTALSETIPEPSEETKLKLYQTNAFESKKTAFDESRIYPLFVDSITNNRLIIYLQPLEALNFMNGTPNSAVAVVRIMGKGGKLIRPLDYSELLHKYGLSSILDLTVAENLLKMIGNWINEGLKPLPIAMHLSHGSIADHKFTEILYELMQKYDYAGKYLEFNIPSDIDFSNSVVASMQFMGFRVKPESIVTYADRPVPPDIFVKKYMVYNRLSFVY